MSKIKAITEDLRNTLLTNKSIKKIHFNEIGQHFFNVHELLDEEGEKTGELYGGLKSEIRETTVKDGRGKTTTKLKLVGVANPASLIVETLTRAEALELPIVKAEKAPFSVNPLIPQVQPATRSIMVGSDVSEEEVEAQKLATVGKIYDVAAPKKKSVAPSRPSGGSKKKAPAEVGEDA